uniref:lipoprotein 17-related variable surface protein n=1 Tax=Mycoplasmopsis primatum TaxID=55604 RepID=UPI000497C294
GFVKTKETTPEILDELLENLNYDDIDWDAKFATPDEFVKGFLKTIRFKSTVQSNSQSPYYGLSLEVVSDDNGNLAAIANQYNGTVSVQLRLANKIFKEAPILSKKSRTFTLSGFTKFESSNEIFEREGYNQKYIQKYIDDLVETLNENCFSNFIMQNSRNRDLTKIDINEIKINSNLDWCYNSNNKELQVVKFNPEGSHLTGEVTVDVRIKYSDNYWGYHDPTIYYSTIKRITLKGFHKLYSKEYLTTLLHENINKESLSLSKEKLPSEVKFSDIRLDHKILNYLDYLYNYLRVVVINGKILEADDTTGKLKIKIWLENQNNQNRSESIEMTIDGFRVNSMTAPALNALSKQLSQQDFTIVNSYKKTFNDIDLSDISATKSFPSQKAKLLITGIDKNPTDESITVRYKLLNWAVPSIESEEASIELKYFKFAKYIEYTEEKLNNLLDKLTPNDLILNKTDTLPSVSDPSININPKSPYAYMFNDISINVLGKKNSNDFNGSTIITVQLKYQLDIPPSFVGTSNEPILSKTKDFLINVFDKKTSVSEVNKYLESIEAKDLAFMKKGIFKSFDAKDFYADEVFTSPEIFLRFNDQTKIGRKYMLNGILKIYDIRPNATEGTITFKAILYFIDHYSNTASPVRSSTYKEFTISGFKKR